MKKSILLVLVMVIVCSTIPLFATTYYEKGNTFFSINAGLNIPAFVLFPNNAKETSRFGIEQTHIKLGGVGSLAFQGCISPRFALGGELGYSFNYVIDGKIFTQVPITAKASFIVLQNGKFDVNVVGNVGINYIKYNDIKNLVPYASIALNPVFYINNNWGFGLSAGFGTGIELTKGSTYNAVFGDVPTTLSVIYRR